MIFTHYSHMIFDIDSENFNSLFDDIKITKRVFVVAFFIVRGFKRND